MVNIIIYILAGWGLIALISVIVAVKRGNGRRMEEDHFWRCPDCGCNDPEPIVETGNAFRIRCNVCGCEHKPYGQRLQQLQDGEAE
jgi:hypothetical protein